jgi:hypothetical protein
MIEHSLTAADVEAILEEYMSKVYGEIMDAKERMAALEQRAQYLEQMVVRMIASGGDMVYNNAAHAGQRDQYRRP